MRVHEMSLLTQSRLDCVRFSALKISRFQQEETARIFLLYILLTIELLMKTLIKIFQLYSCVNIYIKLLLNHSRIRVSQLGLPNELRMEANLQQYVYCYQPHIEWWPICDKLRFFYISHKIICKWWPQYSGLPNTTIREILKKPHNLADQSAIKCCEANNFE